VRACWWFTIPGSSTMPARCSTPTIAPRYAHAGMRDLFGGSHVHFALGHSHIRAWDAGNWCSQDSAHSPRVVLQDELRNAFHLACIKGNVELIEMILDRSFAHLKPKPSILNPKP